MGNCYVLYQDMPTWYEMSYENGILFIRIPAKVYDSLTNQFQPTNPMKDRFLKEFPSPVENDDQLVFPLYPDQWIYGLSEDVTFIGESEGWITIKANLPVVMWNWDNDQVYWSSAYRVSASLAILFNLLRLYDDELEELPSCNYQLLTIEGLGVAQESYGATLATIISPALTRWLSRFPDNYDHPEIKEAMISAHCRMDGPLGPYQEYNFRAWLRKPYWINLSVPGNACGLDPSDYNEEKGMGFKMLPHNTDSPIQQLSLLAGVAKIYQLARQDGF